MSKPANKRRTTKVTVNRSTVTGRVVSSGVVKKTGPSQTVVNKNAAAGCFVSSASAAYRYYANNASAREKAVQRFEHRVTPPKPASSQKTSRRSA